MNSYQEIDKLLGTPLNQIPKPKVPFKWTAGKVALAAGGVAIFIYGVYSLCKDVKSAFTRKEDGDDETQTGFKFKFKNPNEKDKSGEKTSRKK